MSQLGTVGAAHKFVFHCTLAHIFWFSLLYVETSGAGIVVGSLGLFQTDGGPFLGLYKANIDILHAFILFQRLCRNIVVRGTPMSSKNHVAPLVRDAVLYIPQV